MIRKLVSPVCGQVRVTFELPSCIWADRIAVTGDFNDWSHTATPLRQGRDGVWRASVDLPANRRFEFRYLIDGKWQTDYHADGSHTNEFGSENSVVDTGLLTVEPVRESAYSSLLREGAPHASGSLPVVPPRVVHPTRAVQAAA
jgi:hypothetical protein